MGQLQELAEEKDLWNKGEWLQLLHYRQSSDGTGVYESAVDDATFFLSDQGKSSPKKELKETLTAFFKRHEDDNEQAMCRFVGRFRWLSNQLNINQKRMPVVDCTLYEEWREQVQAEKVTLVFPAYYLNSPSSMFGHTLLRLDPKDSDEWPDWLSYAVNFGANVASSDNSIMYAYKGLMGGYPGQFIVTPYYKKILEYSRIERRDIWEYELDLKPKEVARLVEHLWELKNVNFDYFFFDENCSYRLLELLEIARPSINLTSEFVVTAIPVDTVRAIQRTGMVKNILYRPSNEIVLKAMIAELTDVERDVVSQLVNSTDVLGSEAFSSMPGVRKRLMAETAFKLLRFRQNKLARDNEAAKKSHQLLSAISMYPANKRQPAIRRPEEPERGHYSKQVAIKVGERDNKSFTEFGFKMSFHSLEDNARGFLRGAQINIASIRLRRSEENSYFLQSLNFADIISLTPRTEFFDPLSWKVRGGLERVYRDGKDKLVSHITGGAGYSWGLSEDSVVYSLLTTRIEGGDSFKTFIEPALGVDTGVLIHNDIGVSKFELSGEKFTGGTYSRRLSYEQNIELSANQSIRLSYEREWAQKKQFSEFGVSYLMHF